MELTGPNADTVTGEVNVNVSLNVESRLRRDVVIDTHKASIGNNNKKTIINNTRATRNIFENMKNSCELKDMYLPGTLPGNRLPSFSDAFAAFENCQKGKFSHT